MSLGLDSPWANLEGHSPADIPQFGTFLGSQRPASHSPILSFSSSHSPFSFPRLFLSLHLFLSFPPLTPQFCSLLPFLSISFPPSLLPSRFVVQFVALVLRPSHVAQTSLELAM